jgi:hypothetical protein
MTTNEVTLNDTNEAWKLQLETCELYLNACLNDMPDEVIEARREDMIEAGDYAETMQELYDDQYNRRQWLENGRWVVEVA